jgi:hypothetical protein
MTINGQRNIEEQIEKGGFYSMYNTSFRGSWLVPFREDSWVVLSLEEKESAGFRVRSRHVPELGLAGLEIPDRVAVELSTVASNSKAGKFRTHEIMGTNCVPIYQARLSLYSLS